MSGDADVLTKRRQSTGKEVHYFLGPIRDTLEEAEADRRRWEAGNPELREKVEARMREAVKHGRVFTFKALSDVLDLLEDRP